MRAGAPTAKGLRAFDRVAGRFQRQLQARYGDESADAILAGTRTELERLIPDLPDIGGRANMFAPIITVNGWIIALYRAMRAHGKTAEETIAVCYGVSDVFFAAWPRWILPVVRWLLFSRASLWYLRRQAARSQRRQYPEDFVYRVVTEDGPAPVYALEFTECAVNKLYDAQNVPELKPYCNFFDVTYSRHLGLGIDADHTIGLGCETCTLAFQPGRETRIPAPLTNIIRTDSPHRPG